MIILFLADEHSGHKLGLCNPDTVLWDEGPDGQPTAKYPTLGKYQRYLWRHYVKWIAELKALDDQVLANNVGDLTHGIKYPDGLMSSSVDDQTQIAYWNLKPLFDELDVPICRLLVGTYAHTFDGSTEAIVTRLLRDHAPKADIKTLSHNEFDYDGVTFDVAHHRAGPGRRNWLKGNVARLYLQSYMEDDLDHGRIPADYVIGAHYHTWIAPVTHTILRNNKMYRSTFVLLPSLCGMSGHARQATQSQHYIHNGMVAFRIKDGMAEILPYIKETDTRTREHFG